MARATAIQIYLKREVEEDEVLLRLWKAAVGRSRPQTLFRRMLLKGFEELKEAGEIPPGVLEAMHEEDIFRPRQASQQRRPSKMDTAPRELMDEVVSDPDLKPEPLSQPPEPTRTSREESQPSRQPKPSTEGTGTQSSGTDQVSEAPTEDGAEGDYSFIGDIM